MISAELSIEIRGIEEAVARMKQAAENLHGEPMYQAMKDCADAVMGRARLRAPSDTGKLHASIMPEVRIEGTTIMGVVGSGIDKPPYPAYMELGTKPHWPPPGALEVWARRHNASEFLVRRAIAKKGTEPRKYLENALLENKSIIQARLERGVQESIKP